MEKARKIGLGETMSSARVPHFTRNRLQTTLSSFTRQTHALVDQRTAIATAWKPMWVRVVCALMFHE